MPLDGASQGEEQRLELSPEPKRSLLAYRLTLRKKVAPLIGDITHDWTKHTNHLIALHSSSMKKSTRFGQCRGGDLLRRTLAHKEQ